MRGQPSHTDSIALSQPVGSCDASSQNGAGDAFVARCPGDFSKRVIKCNEAVAATFGDEASPLPATGNFGIRD